MKKDILVSVIVPVYNSQETIERCVESILRQRNDNIEIILIDDGSRDNSVAVINDMCAKYSNLILIKQENMGAAQARNNGLDHAKGQYIVFVDSDDILLDDAIKILLDVAVKYKADLIQGGAAKIFQDGRVVPEKEHNEFIVLTREQAMENYICTAKPIVRFAVWGKLFKKELFTNIRFENKRNHEDVEIVAKLINKAKKICYTPDMVYYNYISDGSLSHRSYDLRKINDLISTHNSIISILKSNEEFSELVEIAGQSKVISLMAVIRDIRHDKAVNWRILQNIVYKEFCETSKQYHFDDTKHKMMVLICKISPTIFTIIFDVITKRK